MPVEFVKAEQTAHELTDPPLDDVLLVISLKSSMEFSWNLGDGWTRPRVMRTGDMSLCPANTAIDYRCADDHEVLGLAIPSGHLTSMLCEVGAPGLGLFDSVCEDTIFRDPAIECAALQMWAEAATGDRASDLFIDGLLQTIVASLMRRAARPAHVPTERMASNTLSLVDDFIRANLAGGLSLSELARVSGQTRASFTRAMKHATGKTPHQYVLERRVQAAKGMLAGTNRSLADIAVSCGFASQSHMTDVFRARLGITPGRFREHSR